MNGLEVLVTFSLFLTACRAVDFTQCDRDKNVEGSIHDFVLSDLLETRNVSLSEYRGKVVLIVNVATYCGLTMQYISLNELNTKYENLTILGFPCNHFLMQEPGGSGIEIWNGIVHVRPGGGFEPNFPLFKKIDVNGRNEHSLYTYLKKVCPPTRDFFEPQEKLFYSPLNSRDIRWNFEKFLVDKQGKPVARYDPSVEPSKIAGDIENLLLM